MALQWFSLISLGLVAIDHSFAQQTVVSESHATGAGPAGLAHSCPGLVSFPGEHVFEQEQASYWSSRQSDVTPTCRITPRHALDTSDIVTYLHTHELDFAVVSGGHGTAVGASNTPAGITLDLSSLNLVSIAPDQSLVSVGAGARWENIYRSLDQHRLTVAGARAGTVGVAGFLIGGGISLIASTRGWSCDTVLAVEVILANGTVVVADDVHYPDLFRALKGGGSNFGIPVSFVLETWHYDQLQVAIVQYKSDQIRGLISLLAELIDDSDTGHNSAFELSLTIDATDGSFSAFLMLARFGNLGGTPSLQRLLSIPHGRVTINELTPFESARAVALSNPGGYRQHKGSITILNNATTALALAQEFEAAAINPVLADGVGYRPGMIIQPISNAQVRHENGNALGFVNESAPLLLLSFEFRWSHTTADAVYIVHLDNLISRCLTLATEHGTLHPFIYLNYAAAYQDPFTQLRGTEQFETLRQTRVKYDTSSYLEKHMRHPFKL